MNGHIQRRIAGHRAAAVMPPALGSGPSLPALKRLIRATETWSIAYHPDGPHWSAERREGTAVRYVCGDTTTDLADRIDAAEATP